jgi:hypothetical protein
MQFAVWNLKFIYGSKDLKQNKHDISNPKVSLQSIDFEFVKHWINNQISLGKGMEKVEIPWDPV